MWYKEQMFYLLGVPRFIMEVVSDAAEGYDRHEKMELYKKAEVAEYGIADWRKSRQKSMFCRRMNSRLTRRNIGW